MIVPNVYRLILDREPFIRVEGGGSDIPVDMRASSSDGDRFTAEGS